MTQLLRTLFDMSLTAAFVAVVVFLLRLVLKGRVARQMICLLWLIVFARLLVPITLQSPVSLIPDVELSDPAPVVSEAPETAPTRPVNTSPIQGGVTDPAPAVSFPVYIPPAVGTPVPSVSAPIVEVPPTTETPPTEEIPPTPETPFPWETVLTAVWAAGVAAMLIYGMGSYLSIRRKLRFAIRTKEGFWEDPHLRSPFILGLVRPKIYLPCHMTPYARRFILSHERAHIRRGDHIIKPICWLALALHWFNPLAWVAFLLLSRDIEVACDEKVLRELGSEVKADYSATLLALATNGRFPAPTPLAFGEGDAKTRIKGVLSFKKPALWVTIAAVAVAIVAAVCLLTDPVDKFDPNDYTTQDCYPGLYFERTVVEETGETTVKAYALEDGKPVLVAGWMDQPADNLATLIHPDGEKEIRLATLWEITYQYEQYLVDYMMEQDEGWAQRYVEESDGLVTINSALWGSDLHAVLGGSATPDEMTDFLGGVAYTPALNLLFFWNGTAQVLPLQPSIPRDAHSVKPSFMGWAADSKDRLDILWTGGRKVYSPAPSNTLLFEGDALITYIWDGETWTAHDSLDTIAYADKPVSFDVEKQVITVTYDPNAYTNGNPDIAHITPGMIQSHFSIPEELGHVVTISISGQAKITPRTDGDQSFQMPGGEQGTVCPADREYDLTYAVFALPQGGLSDADLVHVLDLTAIMKWNSLTEEFEITFTGAEEADSTTGEQGQTYSAIPAGAETLADISIASLHMLEDGTVLLRYGDKIVELKDFGFNPMHPDCQMWATDIDGDGVKQIHIIHQFGSGTGVSIDKLTTVVPTDKGLEVHYHDWSEQELSFEQNNSFLYYPESNSISLTCDGEQLWLRLSSYFKDLDWDSYGSQAIVATVAHYSLNPDGTINLAFTPALSDGSPVVHYLSMTANYTLQYRDGAFHQVGGCELKAEEEGMLGQPFTVTMLEASIQDGICRQFELTLNGKTVTFGGRHMTDRDILTYYIDVNEDGVDDPVIFLVLGGGSGYPHYGVHLFDGVTLAEYPAVNITSRGIDPYTFTMEGDTFHITAEGGLNVSFTKEDALAYWAWNPAYADINFLPEVQIRKETSYVTVKDGMLCVVYQCMVGDYWQSYGQLETYLVWKDGLFNNLMPVKTAYVAPDGTVTVGYPSKHTVTERIAYLPEGLVYLFADGDNRVYMQAEGHYGPVLHLNDVGVSDYELSTITNLQRKSLPNLSGPEIVIISFDITLDGRTLTESLRWDEEQEGWALSGYASILGTLPRDMVTPETIPTNPEWYYKVAESKNYALYARHWGAEVMLVYGNFFWTFDHVAHTPHMNLPVMEELDDETVAVISEVNTGTGVGVDELVVYRTLFEQPVENSHYTTIQDYLYDWRDLAADFNRNNTLTYDRDTNSLTLSWNGKTYSSGRLAQDLSLGFDLEDGFTGALIANGDIIRFTPHGDGTFTVRMKTSIGRGNNGSFSDYQAGWFWQRANEDSYVYPSSIGVTGLDLVWTVRFTGSGFEVVTPPTIHTPSLVPEGASLELSLPEAGLFVYTPGPTAEDALRTLILYQGERILLDIRTGDGISDLRLIDLDGDGQNEIAITGWFGMGGTYGDVLTVLKWDGSQWKDYRLSTIHEGDLPAELRSSSAKITGASGDAVTVELAGLTHQLTVSTMLMEQPGTFRLSDTGCPYSVFWFDGQPYLRLQGRLYKAGTGLSSSYCNTGYELLVRPDFKSDGTFDLVPVSLCTLCTALSSSPAELREGEYAIYGESDLRLLDFLPESGTYLYLDGSGQLWLRDGGSFARLNAEICNYNPSEFTVTLLSSTDGAVTLLFRNSAHNYEVSYAFTLTEVHFETSTTSEMIWTPRVNNMPRI